MKRATVCWAAAGALLGLLTLILLGYGIGSSPALWVDSADLTEAAEQVMDCAVSGDFEALSSLLYGAPDLGTPPTEAAAGLLWDAFHESIRYEISETGCILNSGVALNLRVTCLDLSAVTEALQKTAPKLLTEKAMALGDDSLIYDAAHNYREDFLADVMQEAVSRVLKDHPQTVERELTLQLIQADGRWQVIPTGELLQFLSGFVSE